MATPLDILGGIGTVVQILQVINDIATRVKSAADKKSLSIFISRNQKEVNSLREIVEIVAGEESLQTKAIITEITTINELAMQLEDLLKTMETASFIGRFRHGGDQKDELTALTADISKAKSNLEMKIQGAHVGLTVLSNQQVVVQMRKIDQVDENLKTLIAGFEGLVIGHYLRGREPSSDGTVLLNEADLVDLGLKAKDVSPYQDGSRLIDSNMAFGQAIMINGTIGTEGFIEPKQVRIFNNVARNQATMVNASISKETWNDVREDRFRLINTLADKNLLTEEHFDRALQPDFKERADRVREGRVERSQVRKSVREMRQQMQNARTYTSS